MNMVDNPILCCLPRIASRPGSLNVQFTFSSIVILLYFFLLLSPSSFPSLLFFKFLWFRRISNVLRYRPRVPSIAEMCARDCREPTDSKSDRCNSIRKLFLLLYHSITHVIKSILKGAMYFLCKELFIFAYTIGRWNTILLFHLPSSLISFMSAPVSFKSAYKSLRL